MIRLTLGDQPRGDAEADIVEITEHDGALVITHSDIAGQFCEMETAPALRETIIAPPRKKDPVLGDEAPLSLLHIDEDGMTFRVIGETSRGHTVARSFSSLARAAIAFVIAAVTVTTPLHAAHWVEGSAATVEQSGAEGFQEFLAGTGALAGGGYMRAQEGFVASQEHFADAAQELSGLRLSLARAGALLVGEEDHVASAAGLAVAGAELSQAGEIVSVALQDMGRATALAPTEKLDVFATYLTRIAPHLDAAAHALAQVTTNALPEEVQDAVGAARERVPLLARAAQEFLVSVDALRVVLGAAQPVRYLIAFQNPAELRPTGGFVGSFAEVTVDRGVVTQLQVPEGGSYAAQGQLTAYVAAPEPLSLLNPRWEFQDANWSPDFPVAARKMLWFHERSGGPTMDGVVAINATFVEQLLRVLGPITLTAADGTTQTIDAENFLFSLRSSIDAAAADADTTGPKAIVGELARAMMERIAAADATTLLAVVDAMRAGLEEKELQVYFSQNAPQAMIERVGWSGSIAQTSQDSLLVVSANVGANKTDLVVGREMQVDVQIAQDGTVEHTVTLTNAHRGMRSAHPEDARNIEYVRLYVPRGSTLLSATGFTPPSPELFPTTDVPLEEDEDLAVRTGSVERDPVSATQRWEESGHTVFGNWIMVDPGEQTSAVVRYRLPWRVVRAETGWFAGLFTPAAASYSMFLGQQSGLHRDTTLTLSTPASWHTLWSSRPDLGKTVEIPTGRATYLGWIFSQE